MFNSIPSANLDQLKAEGVQVIVITPAALASLPREEQKKLYDSLRRETISIFNLWFRGQYGVDPQTLRD